MHRPKRRGRRPKRSGWNAAGASEAGHEAWWLSTTRTTSPTKPSLRGLFKKLAGGQLTKYVVLRVPEGADSLRRLIGQDGYVARRPTTGELEALEKGLEAMDIPRASFG